MSWRAKDEPPALRSGLLKICAGVVEEATAEPYLSAVEAARQAVAASNDDMTPQQRVLSLIHISSAPSRRTRPSAPRKNIKCE